MTEEELTEMRRETAQAHVKLHTNHVVKMAPGGWYCEDCPETWTKDDHREVTQ